MKPKFLLLTVLAIAICVPYLGSRVGLWVSDTLTPSPNYPILPTLNYEPFNSDNEEFELRLIETVIRKQLREHSDTQENRAQEYHNALVALGARQREMTHLGFDYIDSTEEFCNRFNEFEFQVLPASSPVNRNEIWTLYFAYISGYQEDGSLLVDYGHTGWYQVGANPKHIRPTITRSAVWTQVNDEWSLQEAGTTEYVTSGR